MTDSTISSKNRIRNTCSIAVQTEPVYILPLLQPQDVTKNLAYYPYFHGLPYACMPSMIPFPVSTESLVPPSDLPRSLPPFQSLIPNLPLFPPYRIPKNVPLFLPKRVQVKPKKLQGPRLITNVSLTCF